MSDLHSMSDAEFRSHTKHYIDKLNERVKKLEATVTRLERRIEDPRRP